MAALWAAICASKLGRWVAGVALTVGALIAALLVAFVKGKHAQADRDKAKQAEEEAAFGRLAQQTQTDAGTAAAKVRDDAAKQPPPDTDKRNDLDSTF
jgi:membrane protein implicated in regulation of membrane protease activity